MDERVLLLLGLLMAQSQHGYQINEFIEQNLSRVTTMKKATAYALLDRLERDGHVTVRFEQVGNRPQRKVYSITEAGQSLFTQLLLSNLSQPDKTGFTGDIGLMFIDHLPLQTAIECLRQRLESVEQRLTVHAQEPPHGHGVGVDLALDHVRSMLRNEREWLSGVINRFEQQLSSPTD